MKITGCDCICNPSVPEVPLPSLGPSLAESQVPLSSGLNIPTCLVKRAYVDYYTVCRYLPYGQKPDSGEYIDVEGTEQLFQYFAAIHRISVESYPEPTIEVSLPYRVAQDGDTFRVFPFSLDSVYVEFRRVIDEQTDTGFVSHFDVELFGYDLKEAVGFNVPIKIVAGDEFSDFSLILDTPKISLSRTHVFLESSGEDQMIDITSNLHWWFNYDN